MSFSASAHECAWLFSSKEIASCRALSNRIFRARARGGGASNPNSVYTTPKVLNINVDQAVKIEAASNSEKFEQEEEELVLRHFCRQMQICLSPEESRSLGFASRDHKHWRVRATAIVFFRRFFLNNSLYAHDPRVIMLGCVVLASKIEESRIERVGDLISQLVPKASEGIVLDAELRVVQALNFHTKVFHPQNLCQTIVADLKRKFSAKVLEKKQHKHSDRDQNKKTTITVDWLPLGPIQPHVFEAWLPAAEEMLAVLQLTNACLLFSPLQIAFAALALTENLAKSGLLEKVTVEKDIVSITLKSEADKDADSREGSVLLKYFAVEFGADWTLHKGHNMLASFAALIRSGQNCREHQEIEQVRRNLASIRSAADWSMYLLDSNGAAKPSSSASTHAHVDTDTGGDHKPVKQDSIDSSDEPYKKRMKREADM